MDQKKDEKGQARQTKNITLSVDRRVLSAVRRYAVSRDTTVNALVREYLTNLGEREDRTTEARRRLLELMDQSSAEIGEITWSREDLHDR